MGYSNRNLEPISNFIWGNMVVKIKTGCIPNELDCFHPYSTLVKLSNFGLNTGFTHVEVQVRSGWNWNGSNCSIHSLDPVNFLFVSSKLSLCGFGLDCEIGLRDQRSCFSFFFLRFCWFQTNSNRTLFKEGSSRDYTDQWKN